jgi:hypothetical protein
MAMRRDAGGAIARLSLVVLLFVASGCVGTTVIGAPGDPSANLFLTDFQFDGVLKPHYGHDPDACGLRQREGPPNPDRSDWTNTGNAKIAPSDWVWMVAGEGICAYWTTLAMTTEPPGHHEQSETCNYCDLDRTPNGRCGPMPGSGFPDSGNGFENVGNGLEIRVYAWPLPIFDQRDRIAEFGWATGCANAARAGATARVPFPEFQPQKNARLDLATFPNGSTADNDTVVAVKWRPSFGVLLVPNGGTEMEMPPRLLAPDPNHMGRFTWQVPQTPAGQLDENFSPNLRISGLRVARFKVDTTSASFDGVGRKLSVTLTKVEDLMPPNVPTNVQFGMQHRCVFDPTVTDGRVKIEECIRGGGGRTLISATPTYEIVPPASGLDSVISAPLTWTLNYETGGGFAVPTLAADEQLGVIFILKAVP